MRPRQPLRNLSCYGQASTMARRIRWFGLLLGLALTQCAFAEEMPSEQLRAAVEKSLPLLTKGAAGHMANRTCFACHNQHTPVLALVTARSRGFAVDDAEVAKNMKFINDFLDKNRG